MQNSVKLVGDIIEIKVVGDQNLASVTEMGERTKELLISQRNTGKPQLILDDITAVGNSDIPARKKVSEIAKTLPFQKAVMVGDGSVLMRVGTNLLLKGVGLGNKIRYFENRNEAEKWLLESI